MAKTTVKVDLAILEVHDFAMRFTCSFGRKHAIAENVYPILTTQKKNVIFYGLISSRDDTHRDKARTYPILSRSMYSKTPTFIRASTLVGKIHIGEFARRATCSA